MSMNVEWVPLLSHAYIGWVIGFAVLAVVVAYWRRVPDTFWRAGIFLLLAAVLLNPVFMNEQRESLPDRPVIVVDRSASQMIGGRDSVTGNALSHVRRELEKLGMGEPVVIETSGDVSGNGDETALFTVLRDELAALPLTQVGGTVLITDGQVHDVPPALGALAKIAPFHAVLTGKKDEFDRKVTIVSAPKYGLLSEDAVMTIKVDVYGRDNNAAVPLTVVQDGEIVGSATMTPGEERTFSFTLDHPGQNVFEFSIPVEEGELTDVNNTAPVIVNGVRDRLRVLLVSGEPHMGERAWRNLLKSDPSIDLVHFTILREQTSVDMTPQHELALIAFPVQELFERRLDDFDLIIFDKYEQFSLLRSQYFTNIAHFISGGGAFLAAMGTATDSYGIYKTVLGDILPAQPSMGDGHIMREVYKPALTQEGKAHPVTADIARYAGDWGAWQAMGLFTAAGRGNVLMSGINGAPLLTLGTQGAGRMAVLASDNIWMWSKGSDMRGPYKELLRHTAHWLMKEPELEPDYIKAEASGSTITVAQRDKGEEEQVLHMQAPDGVEGKISLDTVSGGWRSAKITARQNGIYAFSMPGGKKTYLVVGATDNAEFSDVHATEDILKKVIAETGGGMVWFQENPGFKVRFLPSSATRFGDDDWIGFKKNAAYTVRSVESRDLIPAPAALLLLFGGLILSWRRESNMKT
ncbi:MAG: hypothetical protein OXT65_09005 [Alphaproteobacteria bacterium]|nr:hypothetical protein [Alphaproteobacteria bacterium]